jgi:1-acyl-sn-glycerol-3-phosphate acyltransferase
MSELSEPPGDIPARPSGRQIDGIVTLLRPFRRIVQPKLFGLENIPADGCLLVGNHTIYGLLDLPFMTAEVWRRRGLLIRGLGEHAHYRLPVWRDLLTGCGMVRGTRDNVRALMRDRETILVFPGGAREVGKRRGEKYRLIWKERLGFARLAIEQGYPIVPFAAVGAEEMLDVVADDANPVYAQFTKQLERLTRSRTLPPVRGLGLTPIPRPERLYFWFGEPIETERFAGRHEDDSAARSLRDEVRAAVDGGIQFLLEDRERDPNRALTQRLLRRIDP